MLAHIAEWIATVLAAGLIAGLLVLVAAAAGGWLLYRRVRRGLAGAIAMAARYAPHNGTGAVAAGRVKLPPRVVHDLRRLINGPPELR